MLFPCEAVNARPRNIRAKMIAEPEGNELPTTKPMPSPPGAVVHAKENFNTKSQKYQKEIVQSFIFSGEHHYFSIFSVNIKTEQIEKVVLLFLFYTPVGWIRYAAAKREKYCFGLQHSQAVLPRTPEPCGFHLFHLPQKSWHFRLMPDSVYGVQMAVMNLVARPCEFEAKFEDATASRKKPRSNLRHISALRRSANSTVLEKMLERLS